MSTITDTVRLDGLVPDRITLLWGALLVLLELLAVVLFWEFAPVTPRNPLIYVYPFVWINVGLWVATTVSPPEAEHHQRRGATLLVVAYTLVLAYAGGMLGPGGAPAGIEGPVTLRFATVPPGWGPMVTYFAPGFYVQLTPYQVIGYGALAYLVYVTLLDAVTSVAGGALGLLTCMSCSWPVLASVVGGLAGSTFGLTAAVYAQPYGLSTAAYLLTVGVLVWRPTLGWRSPD